jgi:hypothetical protein
LTFAVPAHANKLVVDFELLPVGHHLVLNDGLRVRYYKLSEFIELAKFDAELVKLRKDIQDLGDINNKFKIQMKELERIITIVEDDKVVLRGRADRLEEKWVAAEKLAVENAAGPVWPYVVGAVGVAVGIAGFSMYVAERISD